jgi:predicted dehydrogenase
MVTKQVNIGMIGYKFMGKAHSNAYKDVQMFFQPALQPVMKAICGRTRAAVIAAAKRYGWESVETDWRTLVQRPDIEVVDISSPGHLHRDQAVAAARAGKHIICEKPLANSLAEARDMLRAVKRARVAHMVMFNYRRIPAVMLAREIIRAGEIGEIHHHRTFYLQDWIVDRRFPLVWRLEKKFAGSGALGDIGSHIIDLAHFLTGEIDEVCANMKTFVKQRPLPGRKSKLGRVTVDDAAAFLARFRSGAIGSFEATRFATGRKNFHGFEIYGSKGALLFNFQEMNELQFYSRMDRRNYQGFKRILVTEASHPYFHAWWPPGHIIGYEHTFIHAVADFLNCLAEGRAPSPGFEDGVRCQAVLEAVEQSARERRWLKVPRM